MYVRYNYFVVPEVEGWVHDLEGGGGRVKETALEHSLHLSTIIKTPRLCAAVYVQLRL